MESVFVSHSVKDKKWRQAFDSVCARAGIRADCMEFEKLPAPPCLEIKNRIQTSSAVFVLIGECFPLRLLHTNNWIAFEMGIAYAFHKDIWVIENLQQTKPFAMPMLNHYILCDINWLETIPPSPIFNHVRELLALYASANATMIPSVGLSTETSWLLNHILGKKTALELPRYMAVQCKNTACGISFTLHSNVTSFSCPSCRQAIEL